MESAWDGANITSGPSARMRSPAAPQTWLTSSMIAHSGAGEVANAMLVVGWWLLPIAAYHIVPMFFSALSWRELLPPASRPAVPDVTWIRWIRESINSLLPVASIGGDIAGARLAHLRGVPGTQAAASMVVDTTVGAVTQLVFVITGVALLALRPAGHGAFEVVAGVVVGTRGGGGGGDGTRHLEPMSFLGRGLP